MKLRVLAPQLISSIVHLYHNNLNRLNLILFDRDDYTLSYYVYCLLILIHIVGKTQSECKQYQVNLYPIIKY